MSTVAIRMAGAGKRYTKYEDEPAFFRSVLNVRTRTRHEQLWAVRGVDLEVMTGESIGVIGRNGAGKSTMLQMMGGITAPTEGSVTLRGRVAPLVSVGVGFHPELTGRENIYVNGTILGLSKTEIDERLEAIIDFSEIAPFIDTPVKFYSSGMFVRLGFAVAVEARPDILLVDEVLAVGDIGYQVKCYGRMMEIRESGTTVVVVSHNLGAVQQLAERTVVMDRGRMVFDGPTTGALSAYHKIVETDFDPLVAARKEQQPREPGVASVESFELLTATGTPTGHINAGDEVVFRLRAHAHRDLDDPVFNLIVNSQSGQLVYKEPTYFSTSGHFPAGSVITCDIRLTARLPTGSYVARTTLQDKALSRTYDIAQPCSFYVTGRPMVGGVADLEASFELSSTPATAEAPAGHEARA